MFIAKIWQFFLKDVLVLTNVMSRQMVATEGPNARKINSCKWEDCGEEVGKDPASRAAQIGPPADDEGNESNNSRDLQVQEAQVGSYTCKCFYGCKSVRLGVDQKFML